MTNLKQQTSRASMEDILSSIRRIIDDGASEGSAASVPSAGQVGSVRADDAPAKVPHSNPPAAPAPVVPQYDDRFTPDDAEAFREVAQVLRSETGLFEDGDQNVETVTQNWGQQSTEGKQAVVEGGDAVAKKSSAEDLKTPIERSPADIAPLRHSGLSTGGIMPLVSGEASRSIAETFSALDDVLRTQTGEDLKATTEELLKPMLANWLDENLPSMVERLVRQEIERIARGEPRAA